MSTINHVSRRALLVGGAVAVLAIAAATTVTSAAEDKVVNIGSYSKAVDYAPYLIAKSKGWFDAAYAKLGYKVNYTEFQETPAITEAFGAGKADFVLLAEVPALVVKASKIDVRITSISSALGTTIVVAPDSPIKSIADLKGKKIGILAGTGEDYGLLKTLANAGLQPDDVQLLNLLPPDAKAAFEQGHIDAWAIWPPFPELEEVSAKGRVLPGGEAVKVYSVASARGEVLDKHPDVAHAFDTVLEQGRKWQSEHLDEAQQITATELNFPIDVIKRAWATQDFNAKLTDALAGDFQAKADFLYKGGFVPRRVDVVKEKFIAVPGQS
jgi:sulfonate transport system substrate-binding protein